MRVWPADEEHELAQAAALIAEFRDWFGKALPADQAIAESVRRIADSGEGEFLLGAREDRDPAGICQLRYRWSLWTSSEDCWIEDVFVREQARGSGLGRALVEAAVEHARARGCARIELDVDDANEPALSLYRSLGFSGELKADGRSLLLGRRL